MLYVHQNVHVFISGKFKFYDNFLILVVQLYILQACVPEYPAIGEPEALWCIGHLAWAGAEEVWPAVPDEAEPEGGAVLALPPPEDGQMEPLALSAPEEDQEGVQLLALPAPTDNKGDSGQAAVNNVSLAPAAQVGAEGSPSCLNGQASEHSATGEGTVPDNKMDTASMSSNEESSDEGVLTSSEETESTSEGDSDTSSNSSDSRNLYSDISEEEMSVDGSSEENPAGDPIPVINVPESVAVDMGAVGGLNEGEGVNDKGKDAADALSVLEEAVRLCDRMLAGSQN